MRYDVVAFLKGLENPVPDIDPDDLPAQWQAMYRERTAIRVRSGGQPREVAEYYALLDTLEWMKSLERYPTDRTPHCDVPQWPR